jgi:hypothetical protein
MSDGARVIRTKCVHFLPLAAIDPLPGPVYLKPFKFILLDLCVSPSPCERGYAVVPPNLIHWMHMVLPWVCGNPGMFRTSLSVIPMQPERLQKVSCGGTQPDFSVSQSTNKARYLDHSVTERADRAFEAEDTHWRL